LSQRAIAGLEEWLLPGATRYRTRLTGRLRPIQGMQIPTNPGTFWCRDFYYGVAGLVRGAF